MNRGWSHKIFCSSGEETNCGSQSARWLDEAAAVISRPKSHQNVASGTSDALLGCGSADVGRSFPRPLSVPVTRSKLPVFGRFHSLTRSKPRTGAGVAGKFGFPSIAYCFPLSVSPLCGRRPPKRGSLTPRHLFLIE